MRGLRLLYLSLGAGTAVLNPFIAVILSERGFDPATIGLVGALGAAGLFAAAPVWGHIGDALIGRRQALVVAVTVAAVMALGIGMPVLGLALAALVIAFNLSQGACLALADSLSVSILDDPGRQYGPIRMLASLSFAMTSIPLGLMYNHTGYAVVGPIFAVGAAALFLALVWVPGHRPTRDDHSAPSQKDRPAIKTASRLGSTGVAFHVQPRLFGVLAAVLLVWFSVMISFTFLSLRIVSVGGQASDVALSFGVSALAEVPGMLLAAHLAARLGLRGLFAIGAVGYAASFLAWAVLATPAEIVASRVLTGVSYGALTVAMVLTIGEILPGALQATGQTLYQATATGLAAVAGNIVGGQLFDPARPAFLFSLCAGVITAGAILGWFTLPARARRVTVPAEIEDVMRPHSPLV